VLHDGMTTEGPAELVAFLFTDVEGSSLRWLNHRAAMQEAMRRHDDVLRKAIASYGGDVFKTGGDAFYAAFRRPSDAVGAAVAAQHEIAHCDWSAVGGLRFAWLCISEPPSIARAIISVLRRIATRGCWHWGTAARSSSRPPLPS
jgi:hypothetical protein